VFEIKRFKHASTERKPNQDTQIPLMGMEKLGTKGPAFIASITMRTKFSLSFFRNWILIGFGSLWITRKTGEKLL
jgi:hypothetical protein